MAFTMWLGDPTGGDSLFSSRWQSVGPAALRNEIIARIYPNGLPATGSDRETLDTTDPLATYSLTPTNLAQVDLHEFDVGSDAPGVTDVIKYWVFRPDTPNNKLVIQVFGHTSNTTAFNTGNQGALTKALVEAGYTVAVGYMSEFEGDSSSAVSYHNTLSQVTHLQYFLDGPVRILNELESEGWDAVIGVGLSGGGWLMSLWGALDTRTAGVFSLAGFFPLYMTNVGGGSSRDWEQNLPGLSDIVDYTDLAALCCHPSRQMQQWINDEDPSVFTQAAYESYQPYEDEVAALAQKFGGSFEFHIDDNNQHSYSTACRAAVVAFADGF